ncbi:relaxase/mobilization nuclease domain-containing protein [uncultured Devosia sp.]|uniref:relaxase/mobilization nuclease domain-containing protein n=1 Tax=uncultured Devosia sp. TaxID=211434 RepID=UPI00261538B4|nr:relaxase/mobilization nuclease domain-containing protein [uncultured Devosia sp.]
MILVGSQRGGAASLARHLMNSFENDHVTVHELRGFTGSNLRDAFDEAHAVSLGTKCQQFLFSLSFNPPKDAKASLDDLLLAVERAEKTLGLEDQPRALVIHEKNGRRHLHAVWSRIDAETMKAINLPFYKSRLNQLSRDLFLDHGWELPEGYQSRFWRNPLNFTLAEWQQTQRLGLDPREIKLIFRRAWERSDNLASFRSALEEHGYYIARGDRRGHVAVDLNGEVFPVARFAGLKTKDVTARLGPPDQLAGVEETTARVQRLLGERVRSMLEETEQKHARRLKPLLDQYRAQVLAQRQDRQDLKMAQDLRRRRETAERQSRFRRGLAALLDFLTGRSARMRRENERDAEACKRRDHLEREAMMHHQLAARRSLQSNIAQLRARHQKVMVNIACQIARLIDARTPGRQRGSEFERGPSL